MRVGRGRGEWWVHGREGVLVFKRFHVVDGADGSVEESGAVTGGNKVNWVRVCYYSTAKLAKIPSPATTQTTRRFVLRAIQHGEKLEP